MDSPSKFSSSALVKPAPRSSRQRRNSWAEIMCVRSRLAWLLRELRSNPRKILGYNAKG